MSVTVVVVVAVTSSGVGVHVYSVLDLPPSGFFSALTHTNSLNSLMSTTKRLTQTVTLEMEQI
ncbi:unnamed protein product [Ceratitis capitata]|uniref:(Mediterranean fruit fly) hypothetical protein n=1 Tax=Ceratitis capitata TaxID=7213 RepID=A0A811UV89_CERCA|nr:unnamed protein product [Ceratitis capitata]